MRNLMALEKQFLIANFGILSLNSKIMKVPDSLPQSGTFTDKVMTGLKKALKKLAEEAALNRMRALL